MEIHVVGTEVFYNNWTETFAPSEPREVADYVEEEWNSFMDDNKYEITVFGFNDYDVEVPESEIKSDINDRYDLGDRREDIHDWLEDNWSPYADLYIEAIIVLDYIESGSELPIGQATNGTAGRDGWLVSDRVALVDMANFPEDDVRFHGQTQHYGVAVHELMHKYDTLHEDGAIFSSEEATFMPQFNDDEDDVDCYAHEEKSAQRKAFMTYCSVEKIEDHVDDHIS